MNDSSGWMRETFTRSSMACDFFERFECSRMTPAMMEAAMADGWRHHGRTFFRDMYGIVEGRLMLVVPLRIRVEDFSPSKSQRRLLQRNADLRCDFGPATIDASKEKLFERHAQRFKDNAPESLCDFLGTNPATIPAAMEECRIYEGNKLLAVSFFDRTADSLSSVYAIFEPECERRRPGIFTLLCEIEYARTLGLRYLYLGYTHAGSSFYDYKKQFAGSEFYNWQGEWLPFQDFDEHRPPRHPLELVDISHVLEQLKDDNPEAG